MDYKDRIKRARKHAKLTQGQLAKFVGVKQASISDLETGKSQSSSFSASIAEACGIEPVWLETGSGEMIKPKYAAISAPAESDYAMIPIYSAIGGCGNGYINDHVEINGSQAFNLAGLAKRGIKPENAAILLAVGDSMEPYIFDGDSVLFDMSDIDPKHRQVYVIRRPDCSLSIKRLVQQLNGDWIVKSDNPDYEDERISAESIHELPFLGRVRWRGGNMD
ncbi:MAG: helix-turn-helix domain-containing protein [Thiopseudomonas sp.]|nr:helix-turn-helix domain-containing protein [Thiopseudomonas sp.]